MCGIAGIVSLTGSTVIDPEIVRRMADAIFHRGPDEDGYFFRPGLAMANRRLSIVGLADGRQPMDNEDRSVSVVFNGELFDYPQIRDELIAKGHRFRTHCDTELIPHLWEEHGEGMLERLRGQFAIALWDERRRQLVLARDRFGICPLYWTRQKVAGQDVLLFASEIKALLASGLVPARPDPRGINHVFTFFALPGPVTCFAGINCLLPGRYLKVSPRTPREREQGPGSRRGARLLADRFSRSRRGRAARFRRWGSNASSPLIDEFEAVMQSAVERRLRADVPVVSYLSGGVDSSVVVALACAQRRDEGPIPTFTISRPGAGARRAGGSHGGGAASRRIAGGRRFRPAGGAEYLPRADSRRRGAGHRHLLRRSDAAGTRGPPRRLQGRADRRRGRRMARGLSVVQDSPPARLPGRHPGLQLSQYARRAYLRLTDAPKFPWDACARWKQRSAAPTPGSTSTACSACPSCGSSAPACGSNSATTIHTRTCSSTSDRVRRNGIRSTVRSIWAPG